MAGGKRPRVDSSESPPTRKNRTRQLVHEAMVYRPGAGAHSKKATSKPKPKRRTVREPTPPSAPSVPGVPEDEYAEYTDPNDTPAPVRSIVHPALRDAWQVNPRHKMCILFDAVNPCRQFKRDAVYDEDLEDPFAEYTPNMEEDEYVTDTDNDDGNAQPYAPIAYS